MRLALALAIFSPLTATAETVSDYVAEFESGVICPPPTTGERVAPGPVAGVTHVIEENPPFVSVANQVPAVKGIGFGVRASVVFAEGMPVTMVVTHPPMGEDGVTSQEFTSHLSGESRSITFYQFDYAYELLVGRWTMQALSGDTVIYATEFDILPPDEVPELAGICGFENLLS